MVKLGRPKSKNPKGYNLSIRIEPSVHEKLSAYAFNHGITVAEAGRRAIRKLVKMNDTKRTEPKRDLPDS